MVRQDHRHNRQQTNDGHTLHSQDVPPNSCSISCYSDFSLQLSSHTSNISAIIRSQRHSTSYESQIHLQTLQQSRSICVDYFLLSGLKHTSSGMLSCQKLESPLGSECSSRSPSHLARRSILKISATNNLRECQINSTTTVPQFVTRLR
ncbi:hypothetical protein VTL71DRAFT_8709 [Oculimacula yallundae]|uniref:Uncharacterized protein n=1 Tax=Oculimacula yallundae TaxID=86028 RepID=A0ABR4D0S7_9HELO